MSLDNSKLDVSKIDNSKIRRIVMGEHDHLRGNIRALQDMLPEAAKGKTEALATAKEDLNEMLAIFLRHIEHEEKILRPVLETIDAWGAVRKARMDEEHAEQRVLVMRLAAIDPTPDPVTWTREVGEFLQTLLADMVDEEKTCLSPNLLRDDVVVVDGSSE
jgi:hemerythrin-like domain-containing protein